MAISLDDVKRLREVTGISMMACKKAVEEANGDYDKALEALRKKGEVKAAEKADRTTGQGIVVSYIHTNKKVGAMIQLACETDFVAKNENFVQFGMDLAMQVVANNPLAVNPEDIDDNFIAKEKEIWEAQLKNEGKPEEMLGKIIENKEKKFRDESSLMKQVFIKDGEKTIEQLLSDAINKLGENIKVVKFVRYSL